MAAEARVYSAVSVRAELGSLFQTAISSAYPQLQEGPVIAPCNNPKFGDYQCNNAMGLFGKLKGTEGAPKAPRDVANAILAALPQNVLIAETSLAGPGFINCKLSTTELERKLRSMLVNGISEWAPKFNGKRAIVDFSSPNVAKEMHVGHLRSTIIGDTLARTLEFCGADVLRLNHIGDWGTQFGMLIQHMAEFREGGLGEEGGKDEDVADLMELYRTAKARFDKEEDFKTRSREAVTRLQGGDPASLKAWGRICAASRREFNKLYERLGIQIIERGESFYNPFLRDVVDEMVAAGAAEESDGAICFFPEPGATPLIIQKSDGGFGYGTTDMAAIKHRLYSEKAEWVIYVTDVGQSEHFDKVFAAARRMGWLPEADGPTSTPRVSHVPFGLVLGEDGKKFKTRSGDVVRLVELLDEAKQRCEDQIRERRAEAGEEIDPAEVDQAACAMGYGAVKYADLKNSRFTSYKFSFDEMLNLRGNTAVYLLYAHARIAGIVRKADEAGVSAAVLIASGATELKVEHPKERELLLALCKFPEALEDLLAELMPNRLTDYVYDLCDKFSSFYNDCKVLGSEQEASRLLLCEATAIVIRQCFTLLGITPLYRI